MIDSSSDSKIIFFIISINRTEVSTDRKSWNLNFHKENSRTRISTLFILQILNTLQLYIIIITYPCTYLCIYNILCLGLNNLIGLFICYFIGSKKKKNPKSFYFGMVWDFFGPSTWNQYWKWNQIPQWMSPLLYVSFYGMCI